MNIVVTVLQILLALAFLMAGSGKVASAKMSLVQRDRLQVAPWFWRLTGVLEVAAALGMLVGIWVHPVAAVAAILIGCVMIGAFSTHLRRRDSIGHAAPTLVLFALAVVVFVVLI